MIEVRGKKFGEVQKLIKAFLKENKLDDYISYFNKLMAYDSEDIIDEKAHHIITYIHPGSNEGFFIMIASMKVSTVSELFMIRFTCANIDEVLKVQNALIKELEG